MTAVVTDLLQVIGVWTYFSVGVLTLVNYGAETEQQDNEIGLVYLTRLAAVGVVWPLVLVFLLWMERAAVWAWATDMIQWLVTPKEDDNDEEEEV